MDLVSVIIPAYNHEKYVQETIKSIINQTYQNIELIVVDDGSKDSTWQKIQEMRNECEKRFIKVHFETQENKGTCETLNKLIDRANGEYVYIIASDDIAKPQAIEKEVNFLEKNPKYALCVGDNEIIDSETNQCYWDDNRNIVYDIKKSKYKTFGEFLKQEHKDVNFKSNQFGSYSSLYKGNYIPNGYTIRKLVFDKFRFTKDAPLEDYYMMLQISKYYKLKYLDEVLFSYRWHCANTITQTKKMNEYHHQTKEYEESIRDHLIKTGMYDVLPDVILHIQYGPLTKKRGIPFVFEIHTYFKQGIKTKIIKLFGIQIYKYTKTKRN